MNVKGAATALVLAVVLLCAWPLAAFSMNHYLPELDDELSYFLLVKTFRSQGFHNGYSFTNDQIPAGAVHFNIQGPGTVPLYSGLSRVVGWTNYSPYLANLALFMAAWLLLAYALRRHPHRQVAASLFVLANAYFFFFLPSVMQESVHLAFAVAMAALWMLAIERASLTAWAALLVLAVVATVIRYSWAVVVPCFVYSFLMQRTKTWPIVRRVLVAGIAGGAAGAVTANTAVKLMIGWALPPAAAARGFSLTRIGSGVNLARFADNVQALSQFKSIGMFAHYPRYFVASLEATLIALVCAAVFVRRDPPTRAAASWGALVLAAALMGQLLFYTVDGWRDFRVLLPAHAFAGLMFFSRAEIRWDRWALATRATAGVVAALLIAANMVWAARGIEQTYRRNWSGRMVELDAKGRADFAALAPHFVTGPGDDAFCRTMYAEPELSADPRMAYLPDAFSMSVVSQFRPGPLPPLRGKYVLVMRFPEDAPDPPQWRTAFERSGAWRRVADVDDYTLLQSTVNCLSGA